MSTLTSEHTARDSEGNYLDGCGAEHDPATNLGCVMRPAEAPALDYTDVMIEEMRQGVARYWQIAADARDNAANNRRHAENSERDEAEYRAKALALSGLIERLGYEPPAPPTT